MFSHISFLNNSLEQAKIINEIEEINFKSNKVYRLIYTCFIVIQFSAYVFNLISQITHSKFNDSLIIYKNFDYFGLVINLLALLLPLPSVLNTLTNKDYIIINHHLIQSYVPSPRSSVIGLSLSLLALVFNQNVQSTRTVICLSFATISEFLMRKSENDARKLHDLKYNQKGA